MSELIAFIGVGNMGNPMSENLMKAGKKVKVFDVSKKMIEKAKEKKLKAARTHRGPRPRHDGRRRKSPERERVGKGNWK